MDRGKSECRNSGTEREGVEGLAKMKNPGVEENATNKR